MYVWKAVLLCTNIIFSVPYLMPEFTIHGWLLSINVVFHNMTESLGAHTGSLIHAQFVSVQNMWAARRAKNK